MIDSGFIGKSLWFYLELPDTRRIDPQVLVSNLKESMSEGKTIWEALDQVDTSWIPSMITINFRYTAVLDFIRKNKYTTASKIPVKEIDSISINVGSEVTDKERGKCIHFRNPDKVLKSILKQKITGLPLLEHYAVYKYIRKDT